MNNSKFILGTMNFGPQVDSVSCLEMINRFTAEGYGELDSAYVYNGGETETILGEILNQADSKSISIATKVHPRITGKLDAEAVADQFRESLSRMNRSSVDILYFHFPDPETPIDSALEKVTELHQKGKIKELGLSNFPAWMVADICHICKKNGWLSPTVYQGMYNGLARNVENELFPALRKFRLRFYAFNPLAGGMLTGKHLKFDETPAPGRFARLQSYRDRYWKENYFKAINNIRAVCQENELEPAEAAYRWLAFHSQIDSSLGDGLIVGASSVEQLEKNMNYVKHGRLPEVVVTELNNAWQDVKADSPPYFRFFTSL